MLSRICKLLPCTGLPPWASISNEYPGMVLNCSKAPRPLSEKGEEVEERVKKQSEELLNVDGNRLQRDLTKRAVAHTSLRMTDPEHNGISKKIFTKIDPGVDD